MKHTVNSRDYNTIIKYCLTSYLKQNNIAPILRIGDQVLRFDVSWPKHLQEVRSTVYIHVQSM